MIVTRSRELAVQAQVEQGKLPDGQAGIQVTHERRVAVATAANGRDITVGWVGDEACALVSPYGRVASIPLVAADTPDPFVPMYASKVGLGRSAELRVRKSTVTGGAGVRSVRE